MTNFYDPKESKEWMARKLSAFTHEIQSFVDRGQTEPNENLALLNAMNKSAEAANSLRGQK